MSRNQGPFPMFLKFVEVLKSLTANSKIINVFSKTVTADSNISLSQGTFSYRINASTLYGMAIPVPILVGGAGYAHDFIVNWGDGTPTSHVTSYNDSNANHTYAVPGTYDVTLTGHCEYFGTMSSSQWLFRYLSFTGDMGFKILKLNFTSFQNFGLF